MTDKIHRLLQRQIERYLDGDTDVLPDKLFRAINDAYHHADKERLLLERSLEFTSEESNQRYKSLKTKLQDLESAQQELTASYELLTSTMDAGFDGVLHADKYGKPLLFNKTMLEMSGLSIEKFKEMDYRSIVPFMYERAQEPELLVEQLSYAIGKGVTNRPIEIPMKDGRFLECKVNAINQNNLDRGLVWILRDVTELKNKEKEAQYRALHDGLTKLPNRVLFMERLEFALKRAKRAQKSLSVIFIDLDEFKLVNDSLGHDVGDHLLIKVADRISQFLRDEDSFARLGGDEFVILIDEHNDKKSVNKILERIKDALQDPFDLAHTQVYMTASLGVANYPEHGVSASNLIKKADMAMYNSKNSGKNTFSYYSEKFERYYQRRLSMKNALIQALENDEFCLYYQPKFDLNSDKLVGTEALIRWQKDEQLILPAGFIAELENNSLIISLGQWVINKACQQISEWNQAHSSKTMVSLNISAKHFQFGDLVSDINQAVRHYSIEPAQLMVEITESSFIGDIDSAIKKIVQLNRLGVSVSIDDFGTGYSSFTYLSQLPIQELKIDRSFIVELQRSEKQKALVESIINIAHTFELAVVAEGVEDSNVIQALKDIGCDLVQGYFYSEPINASDFAAKYLASRSSNVFKIPL
ncbi:MAG: EAL domain-containing protein [Gammaproteobacteria bacterium]|nr:EAL domain-containing protein [Gammaproteobacteria bacterium]